MNRHSFEVIAGIIVILVSIVFMTHVFRIGVSSHKGSDEQILKGCFNNIDGIKIGSDVKIGGIKVGSVTAIKLDKESFRVCVNIAIDEDIKIPEDSTLAVSSSGIFGGKYLAIKIGASEDMMQNNHYFTSTQSTLNLEDLISKFATSYAKN
jgi:phospholipid/cholesterol/gamma-HCH transport system substrate-binding protein